MKKSIFLCGIIALLLSAISCGGGGNTVILPPVAPEPPVIDDPTPDPTPEPDPIPEPAPTPDPAPEPETLSRTIFIYNATAETIGTSDGIYYYELNTGKSANAHDGFVSVGDILHGIDDTGTSTITSRLPVTPDAVAISGDVWSFENIDPVTASGLGALPKWYTKIYQGSTEYGAWYLNQWQTVSVVVTNSGDITTTDTVGKLRSAKEPDLSISTAVHDGIMIHGMDAANLRAYIRDNGTDTLIYGASNYFISANKWIEASGIWYSWNGFTWDGTNFTESATALRDFIVVGSNAPVVIPVGSRIEHSEAVTYWIECNTGWLYRHTPSIDRLEMIIQLWQGSGLRVDGIACAAEIKPVITDENMFFTWNVTVWKYNFTDSLVSSFAAGVLIWGM